MQDTTFFESWVQAILLQIHCPPYYFRLTTINTLEEPVIHLQACKDRIDVDTGKMSVGKGAKHHVSFHATREEIVQKALKACIEFAEHDVREHFTWRGKRIFGPHLSHDRLWEIAGETVKREEK